MLRELDYEIDILCVVQWGVLWFAAPSWLNAKLDCHDARLVKYHEVTNGAIEAAVNAPYGAHVTPRARVLWSMAKVLDRLSDEDWDLDKGMIGWER